MAPPCLGRSLLRLEGRRVYPARIWRPFRAPTPGLAPGIFRAVRRGGSACRERRQTPPPALLRGAGISDLKARPCNLCLCVPCVPCPLCFPCPERSRGERGRRAVNRFFRLTAHLLLAKMISMIFHVDNMPRLRPTRPRLGRFQPTGLFSSRSAKPSWGGGGVGKSQNSEHRSQNASLLCASRTRYTECFVNVC